MVEIDGSNAIGNIGGPSPPVAFERLAYRGEKRKHNKKKKTEKKGIAEKQIQKVGIAEKN